MNRVLTPELMKEVCNNVIEPMKSKKLSVNEFVNLTHSGLVEALKTCDTLGEEYTQRLYDLGFPDDCKKSMLTLQEILDVCDKGMRWKGKTAYGNEVDMPVKLTHKLEDDGYFTYRFVGTFEGKDYCGVGCCYPCALEALFNLLERDLECGFLTFEIK